MARKPQQGHSSPQPTAAHSTDQLPRLQSRLAELIPAEQIPERLDTPNDAFDGLKPLEVIERGEIDRLWDMIFYLESGVAS